MQLVYRVVMQWDATLYSKSIREIRWRYIALRWVTNLKCAQYRQYLANVVEISHHAWTRLQPNWIPSWHRMQFLERHGNLQVV